MTSKRAARRLKAEVLAMAVFTTVALAGCGADVASLQAKPVTGYSTYNVFTSTGHSVAALPDGRYRVTATGSAYTPASHLEKIALARAAEFGKEQNKKYFQATAPQVTIRCGKREYIEKGQRKKLNARGYNVVEIDVAYSNQTEDPSAKMTRDTAEQLKAELQSAPVPDEAAAAQVMAQCGA